jgi:signal transduction histidine kinase
MIHGVEVPNRSHLVPTTFVPRESCGCTAGATLSESGSAEDGLARDRLLHRLERLLIEGEATTVQQVSALERAVDAIERGLNVGAKAHETVSANLAEAAVALHAVNPRWTTISAVVSCLQLYQRDLGGRVTRGQSAARFQGGITEMAVELSRCITQAAAAARASLNETMDLDHELSVSLLSGIAGDPKSLDWLATTPGRAGCLGLWSAETGGPHGGDRRLLDIAGSYLRGGGKLDLPAQSRMEAFPPDGLLDGIEWRPDELVVVFPTKTATLDLGLLAVVTPLRPAAESERDRLFENNALLSVSIERQVMMERLRRSNADLATFSHAMAHDLRNPLATIAMWTSVARMRAEPGDDAGPVLQVVDQIKDVADDAMELVSDLLHYAELDRGDTALEPVDLNLAAARVIATIGSSIAQQGALIETGNLPTVPGRPGELQLVLQNLIGNAIKYRSDQPPRIRLDALRDGEVWKIRCRDNGQGIPGSTREEVFEPFTRGQTSAPGSGLGLATCRRIVEGHGGHIWIASSGNLGTTFAFTLPVGPEREPGEAEAPPVPAAHSDPGDGTHPRQSRDAA